MRPQLYKSAAKLGEHWRKLVDLVNNARKEGTVLTSPEMPSAGRVDWRAVPGSVPYAGLGAITGANAADPDEKGTGALKGALAGAVSGLAAHPLTRRGGGWMVHQPAHMGVAGLTGLSSAAFAGSGYIEERAKKGVIGAATGAGVRAGRAGAEMIGQHTPYGTGALASMMASPLMMYGGGKAGKGLAEDYMKQQEAAKAQHDEETQRKRLAAMLASSQAAQAGQLQQG